MIDGESAQDAAPYLRVAARMRALITEGSWAVGDRLPSRAELGAAMGGVGENVVRRAQELLIAEGLLDGRAGSGTYVSAPRVRRRLLRSSAAWKQRRPPVPGRDGRARPHRHLGVAHRGQGAYTRRGSQALGSGSGGPGCADPVRVLGRSPTGDALDELGANGDHWRHGGGAAGGRPAGRRRCRRPHGAHRHHRRQVGRDPHAHPGRPRPGAAARRRGGRHRHPDRAHVLRRRRHCSRDR